MGPRAQKKKPTLSVGELEGLKDERSELQHTLKEAEGYGEGGPGSQFDSTGIKKQISRFDHEIEAGSPGRLTDKEKDGMYREEKQLEEQFQKNLPTRYEMNHPGRCPGAVRKHLAWLDNNEKTGYVARYREIQRTLRTGEEKSIETLRKDK